mmetsp:Transcript_18044/g.27765  ORF Transcript_18044/g.27765 Transcript_18044/m.27765 type:complete len:391 (+) Transcript_18044:228-1400(+)
MRFCFAFVGWTGSWPAKPLCCCRRESRARAPNLGAAQCRDPEASQHQRKGHVPPRHAEPGQLPCNLVTAHQRRAHDLIKERIGVDAVDGPRCAGRRAFPPALFDAHVIAADACRGQGGQRAQDDQGGEGNKEGHCAKGHGNRMGIALPQAHLAGRIAQGLKQERARQQESGPQCRAGDEMFTGHNHRPIHPLIRLASVAPAKISVPIHAVPRTLPKMTNRPSRCKSPMATITTARPGTVFVPGRGTRIEALKSTRPSPTIRSVGALVSAVKRGRLIASIRFSHGADRRESVPSPSAENVRALRFRGSHGTRRPKRICADTNMSGKATIWGSPYRNGMQQGRARISRNRPKARSCSCPIIQSRVTVRPSVSVTSCASRSEIAMSCAKAAMM